MSCCLRHIISTILCCLICRAFSQAFPPVDTASQVNMHGTYYHDRFVGRKTSSGEVFSQDKFTAAHRSYKFGTLLLVTNPANGKQVIVRVNDRCPKSNILDMTRRAASLIDVKSRTVKVLVLPDSYLPLWEKQEDYMEIINQGGIGDYVANGFDGLSSLPGNNTLFDLELFCAASRDEAMSKTAALPIYYHDRLTLKSKGVSCPVRAVLELSLPANKIKSVIEELRHLFPDVMAVKCG